jgi:Protein of unknown function (DUF3800)
LTRRRSQIRAIINLTDHTTACYREAGEGIAAKDQDHGFCPNAATAGLLGFMRSFSQGEPCSVATFQVHCDESGKLQDSKCVTFSGCIFREDAVAEFSRRWTECLEDAQIADLHMKDAMRFGGEFRGWKNHGSDRDALLETLGKLLHDRGSQVVFTMDTKKFKLLDQNTQGLLKNPVYAGFDGLLKVIMSTAVHHKTPEHRFHLVYDLSEEYSTECLRLFNKMRMRQPSVKTFFPSIAFADDREFPPLQAADMVAYCAREEFLQGVGCCTGIVGKLLDISGSSTAIQKTVVHKQGRPLGEGMVE